MLRWIAAARAELVRPRPRRAVLVDVGCGGGLLAPHVAGKGYRHIGVDLVTSALLKARERGVVAVRGDALRLPIADGCADVVSAGELFEHVPDLAARSGKPVGCCGRAGCWSRTRSTPRCGSAPRGERGERLPGFAPPGIHDPSLFVSPTRLTAECARHGVRLRVRGVRPATGPMLRWFLTRRGEVPIVPTRSTAVLYQAWGYPMSDLAAAAIRLAPQFAARAAAHDVDGSFPAEDFADLRAAGLLGIMVPTALGGSGAGFAEYTAVAYELGRGSGATALIFNMHAAVTGALSRSSTDSWPPLSGVSDEALPARDRFLRAAARGLVRGGDERTRGRAPGSPSCPLCMSRSPAASGSGEPSRSSPAPGTPTATWWRPGVSTTPRWCRSSSFRPAPRACAVRAHLGFAGHARHQVGRSAPGRHGPA